MGRTIWAEAKCRIVPCYLGRTLAKGRKAWLAEHQGSAEYCTCQACLGSIVVLAEPRLGSEASGPNQGWFGSGCTYRIEDGSVVYVSVGRTSEGGSALFLCLSR